MVRVLAFVVMLVVSPALEATVLVPAEFREIVVGSEIIAHARVVDVRPQWAEGRRRIDTVVTIELLTVFKGGTEGTLAVKVPGGQLGRYRSVMVGAPVFRLGDEAVLFLRTGESTLAQVFGLNQGVFRIRPDRVSGRHVVVPPPLLASRAEPEVVRRGSVARRALSLEAFGAQVRAVIAEQAGAAR